jgi:hypothetical protein
MRRAAGKFRFACRAEFEPPIVQQQAYRKRCEVQAPPGPPQIWTMLLIGYLLTVAIETPVLVLGLSRRHALRDRVLASLWLNACSYPMVILVFPYWFWFPYSRGVYLAVSETFAPVAECLLFWLACGTRLQKPRAAFLQDMTTIVAANVASFLLGEWLFANVAWLRDLAGVV